MSIATALREPTTSHTGEILDKIFMITDSLAFTLNLNMLVNLDVDIVNWNLHIFTLNYNWKQLHPSREIKYYLMILILIRNTVIRIKFIYFVRPVITFAKCLWNISLYAGKIRHNNPWVDWSSYFGIVIYGSRRHIYFKDYMLCTILNYFKTCVWKRYILLLNSQNLFTEEYESCDTGIE